MKFTADEKLKKLKVGDKLLCKKNIKISNVFFYAGEYYTINYIFKYIFYNYNYREKEGFDIYIKCGSKRYCFNREHHIYDYFYTTQEIRKMKLKQLNDESM